MVVFFDAGGTLIRPREPVGAFYARRAAEFGVAVRAELLEDGFRRAFAAAPPLAFPGVAASDLWQHEQGWWRAVVRQAFGAAPPADFEACFQALYRDFAEPAAWIVFDDVAPVLSELQRRGHRLGVISNFDARLLPILDGVGLAQFFESVTISSAAGAAKPDRRIFELALGLHGARPEEALHVGDSLVDDVEGARAAGLRAVPVRGDGPGLEAVLASV